MSKALITAAGPHMEEVLGYSEPTFRAFAEIHNYELVISRDVVDQPQHHDPLSRSARWAKIGLLERALQQHEVAVWMDADVMIRQFDRDITDDMAEGAFQAMVIEEHLNRSNPNTGVWVMRQDERSERFLGQVRSIGQLAHCWADQAAVCVALGWELRTDVVGAGFLGTVSLGEPTDYYHGTAWLPAEWNPIGASNDAPRTRHFAGMSNADRLPEMSELSQQLLADGLIS